ncbi:MAG: toll/interleukin-1 receptor domain-containing protein [Thiolinea sp.]
MTRTVFVSYSRLDSERVQHAVALLEAGGAEVFRDIDDIQFGDQWEQVIRAKLKECERVMVFWSRHAQGSEWVGKEYLLALSMGKRLVPVLLDGTPLPPELGKFHALTNFMPPARASWLRYGGWILGGLALLALVASLLLPTFQVQKSAPDSMAQAPEMSDLQSMDSTDALRPPPPRPMARPPSSLQNPDNAGAAQTMREDEMELERDQAGTQTEEPIIAYQYDDTAMVSEQAPVSLWPWIAAGLGLLLLAIWAILRQRKRSAAAAVDTDTRTTPADQTEAAAFVDMVFADHQQHPSS